MVSELESDLIQGSFREGDRVQVTVPSLDGRYPTGIVLYDQRLPHHTVIFIADDRDEDYDGYCIALPDQLRKLPS